MTTKSSAAGAFKTCDNPTFNDYLYRWRKLVCLLQVLKKPIKDGNSEIGGKVDMLRDCLPVLLPDKKDEKSASIGIYIQKKEVPDKTCTGGSMTHDFVLSLTYGEKTPPTYREKGDETPQLDTQTRLKGQELVEFVEKRIASLKFVLEALNDYEPQELIEKHWFEVDDREKMTQSVKNLAEIIKDLDIDVSKRFAMEKFLGMTPEEIVYNERLLAEERLVEDAGKTAVDSKLDTEAQKHIEKHWNDWNETGIEGQDERNPLKPQAWKWNSGKAVERDFVAWFEAWGIKNPVLRDFRDFMKDAGKDSERITSFICNCFKEKLDSEFFSAVHKEVNREMLDRI